MLKTLAIQIEDLLLDLDNPRYGRGSVGSQREAITAMIHDQGPKLVRLADHILKHGINPLDRLAVARKGSSYIALEGNRRVLTLKLLNNPDLAEGTPLEQDFRKRSKGLFPRGLDCVVFPNVAAARPWLELRHSGPLEGAGVVQWSAAQKERFLHRPGSNAARGLAFIEAARVAYKSDAQLRANLDRVERDRLTTLGRLVADPDFRRQLGIKAEKDRLMWHYGADELRPFIERVAQDVAGDLNVTQIKTKVDRAKYLKGLGSPGSSGYHAKPFPLGRASATGASASRSAARLPRPGPLLSGYAPKNLGKKLSALVTEVRKLNVEQFPNACALLVRAVVEISVDEVYDKKGWPIKYNDTLRDKIKHCLREIDPTGKAKTFHGIRVGLDDPNSLISVTTLHQFVHNKSYRALPGDIRTIADNYEVLLKALDALV
jgi:hypothetical protein